MTNIRERAFSVLTEHFANTPITVYNTRIDPFKLKDFPAISINVPSISERQKSHDWIYEVNATLELSIFFKATTGYAALLDAVVDEVKRGLFHDDDYLADFEFQPDINCEYAYLDLGDVNIAAARLTLVVTYIDEYSFEDELPYLEQLFAEYTSMHVEYDAEIGYVANLINPSTDSTEELPEADPLYDAVFDKEIEKMEKQK